MRDKVLASVLTLLVILIPFLLFWASWLWKALLVAVVVVASVALAGGIIFTIWISIYIMIEDLPIFRKGK